MNEGFGPSTIEAQCVFSVMFLLVGLSHLLHPAKWSEFFRDLFSKPYAPFVVAIYTAPIGLLIIFTHNVWVWDWPVVITAAGWAMCIKPAIYLVYPSSTKSLAKGELLSTRKSRVVGMVAILVMIPVVVDAFSNLFS